MEAKTLEYSNRNSKPPKRTNI